MSLLATLVELGFSQNEAQEYSDLFRSHDITQNELMSLDHELLKEMGITKIGHRIRLLKLKQMRDSLPTSYSVEDKKADKKAATKKKKKEEAAPSVEDEPVQEKPKKRAYKKRDPAASKKKKEEPAAASKIDEVKSQPIVESKVEPVQATNSSDVRSKPKFAFDLPDDVVSGASDSPRSTSHHVPYSLDEGFSLEIPASFSKALRTPANNNNNNTNTRAEEVQPKEEEEREIKTESKRKRARKSQKKEVQSESEETPAIYEPDHREHEHHEPEPKETEPKERGHAEPIVAEPESDEEESEGSLEQYIADEVMEIDADEEMGDDLVLQNEGNTNEPGTTDEQAAEPDDEDDYMKVLNNKVLQSLDGIDVADIVKGTPNKLKDIVVNSFVDITPRKHQWEAVYNIIRDLLMHPFTSTQALEGAPGDDKTPPVKNYLIQHSAGSGKSITIACLVYMLYMLKGENNKRKFDMIIVMNDRKLLDEQLGRTVKKFLRAHSIKDVARVQTAANLKELLYSNEKRVIITTVQKFAQLLATGNTLDKTIAIIADEAHRTHGRSSTRRVHEFLTGATRQSSAITYFSFTCTPTAKALEMFGVKHGSTYSPFCTYSMQQALADKVIVDVLQDYSSVAAMAEIEPSAMEAITKTYEKGLEATKTLMRASQDDRKVLQEKAKYIINHFVKKSQEISNEKFTAKGMLVTASRKHIIWYKQELEALIKQLPEDDQFDIVAAFTPFEYEGKVVTQDDEAVNGKYARQVVKAFKKRSNRVKLIIVADKLRTGFDEPKLAIMYIDKKLRGTNVVQTLGRLNRIAPGKESVSVVDFVNSRKEISEAFGQYWATTTLVDMSGRDPLQTRFETLAQKLLAYEGMKEQDLVKAVNTIIMEDYERKKNGMRTVERELTTFTNLCDRLQIEHPQLPYKFAVDLRSALFSEYKTRLAAAREILSDISLNVNGLKVLNQGSIDVSKKKKDLKQNNPAMKVGELSEPSMNVGQIVRSVNEANFIRMLQMKDSPKNMSIPLTADVEDYSNDNLEFAKGIWSRRQRPRTVSDIRRNNSNAVKPVDVPVTNTTAEDEKQLARELESELMAMSSKVSSASHSAPSLGPTKQLVLPVATSSSQIKKLLQQQNPRENFKPKIAGELTKSATSSSAVSRAPSPNPVAAAPVPAAVPRVDQAVSAANTALSPAKRKIDAVEPQPAEVMHDSGEPERKKQKIGDSIAVPVDLTDPIFAEDPMDDHDTVLHSHESSRAASPHHSGALTADDKLKLAALLKMVDTNKWNSKERRKVLRALAGHAILEDARNYLRDINAIDVLIKEFLVPLTPNRPNDPAIYRVAEETALAATCLYELARNKTNAELIAKKGMVHIIGMLMQKSDLQLLGAKLLGILCVNDTLKQQIGAQAIPALIALLNVTDEEVKHEAALTLRVMSSLVQNCQLLVDRGGVPNLVNLLGAKYTSTCLVGIKTLIDVCTSYNKVVELVKSDKAVYRWLPKWMNCDSPQLKAKAKALNDVLRLTPADYNTARQKWPEINASLRRSHEASTQPPPTLTRSWESKHEPIPPTSTTHLPQVVTAHKPVIITPPRPKAQPRTASPLSKSGEALRVTVPGPKYAPNYPPPRSPQQRGPPPPRGRGQYSRGPSQSARKASGDLRHSGGRHSSYRSPSPSRDRPRSWYRRSRSPSPRGRASAMSHERSRSRSRDRYRRSRSRSRDRSRGRSRSRDRRSRSRSRSRDRK